MTRLIRVDLTCPKCSHPWTTTFHASICTWLDPELIDSLYRDGVRISCPNCKASFQANATILINAPSGMFWLDTGQELEVIRRILREAGVVDEKGNPVPGRPRMSDSTDPPDTSMSV